MNFKLEEKIDKIKKMSIQELCEKFNCQPEEICMGNYIARNTDDTVCPYKVILGFANFEGSNVTSLGNLEIVYGEKLVDLFGKLTDTKHQAMYMGLNLKNSKITDLRNLRKVYGSISLNQNITTLGNLEYLGSNLYLNNTQLSNLGNLQIIDGTLNLEDDELRCKLTSLGKLKHVRRIVIATNSLKDLGDLEEFKELSIPMLKYIKVKKLFETNFVHNGSKYIKRNINVTQE